MTKRVISASILATSSAGKNISRNPAIRAGAAAAASADGDEAAAEIVRSWGSDEKASDGDEKGSDVPMERQHSLLELELVLGLVLLRRFFAPPSLLLLRLPLPTCLL